jgi:hypothetical protein
MRDDLVDEIDEYLDAIAASPDPEAVALFVIEVLETHAEDEGIDDLVATLEEEGEVDGTLAEALEEEMRSNDEFEFTGEEVVSLVERMCGLEWENDPSAAEDDDDDDDDFDDEDDDLNF